MIKVEKVPSAPVKYDTKLTFSEHDLGVLSTLVKKGLDAYRQEAKMYATDRYRPQRIAVLVNPHQQGGIWDSAHPEERCEPAIDTFEVGFQRGHDSMDVVDIMGALKL